MEMFNSTANHSTQSKKEFLLVFFFVLLAANPFLRQNIEMSIAVLFIYLLICFGKVFYLKQNDVLALLIITYFIAFEIAHRLLFDLDNTYTIVRIITYFLAGFSVIKVTKSNFLIHYTRAIYILSLISIAFYIIALILPTTYNNLSNLSAVIFPLTPDYNNYMTPTLIFYTFDPAFIANKAYLRNPGFAWEAGGFATYVNIAIFFYLVKSGINNIPEFFKNKVILVLTTSLLLTFSTSGYICFAFIILMFFIGKISSKNYIFLILFIIVFFYAFNQLDFLSSKISEQINQADYSQNRFGAALLDWEDIKERPLLGWSRDISVVFGSSYADSFAHRPNGLTNFIRSYGLIYFISFFLIMHLSLKKFFKSINSVGYSKNSLLFIGIIFIMGFSQLVVHTIFTMCLLFWGLNTKSVKDTL